MNLAASLGLEPSKNSNASLHEKQVPSQVASHNSVLPVDLQEIVAAWESLASPFKAAVLAIVRTVNAGTPKNFPDTPPPMSGESINPAEIKGE